MAYIRKMSRKKGPVYRVEVSFFDGSKKAKSFRTKDEAHGWGRAQEELKSTSRNGGITLTRMSFHEFSEKWFQEYAKYHQSEGWQLSVKKMYETYIQPFLGHLLIREIRPPDIVKLLNSMRASGLSATYANLVRVTLHKMFDEAVKTYRFATFNPVSAVKPFTTEPFVASRLSKEEAFKVLSWADQEPLGIALHLALQLGLREGELVGLKWDAVDLQKRQIIIRRKWEKKTKVLDEYAKGKKVRMLGIYPDGLLNRLIELRTQRPQAEFVVCNSDGKMVTPDRLIRTLKKAIASTGVTRVTLHGLRHSFASIYMESGGDLYDLQKVMGHQSASTTERYRHTDPEYLKKKCDVFDLYSSAEIQDTISAEIPPVAARGALRLVQV